MTVIIVFIIQRTSDCLLCSDLFYEHHQHNLSYTITSWHTTFFRYYIWTKAYPVALGELIIRHSLRNYFNQPIVASIARKPTSSRLCFELPHPKSFLIIHAADNTHSSSFPVKKLGWILFVSRLLGRPADCSYSSIFTTFSPVLFRVRQNVFFVKSNPTRLSTVRRPPTQTGPLLIHPYSNGCNFCKLSVISYTSTSLELYLLRYGDHLDFSLWTPDWLTIPQLIFK